MTNIKFRKWYANLNSEDFAHDLLYYNLDNFQCLKPSGMAKGEKGLLCIQCDGNIVFVYGKKPHLKIYSSINIENKEVRFKYRPTRRRIKKWAKRADIGSNFIFLTGKTTYSEYII